MKRVIALATVALMTGCAVPNPFKASQTAPSNWTTWVCDSHEQVLWKYADASKDQVDVRLGGGDQVYRLKQEVSGSGVLYSNEQLAFHTKGDEGLVYWVATDDLIGRGCKAP